MSFYTPYNFVPLSKYVVTPKWADKISHDVPFKDGQSGIITYEITAHSPIFTRDFSDDKQNKSSSFSKLPNGKFFIHGDTMKGAIKNVFKIMTFSKLTTLNKKKLPVRDLSSSNNVYMRQMNNDGKEYEKHCGWLRKDQNGYSLEDCETPIHINHRLVDKIVCKHGSGRNMVTFSGHFHYRKIIDGKEYSSNNSDMKTAEYKYEKFTKGNAYITNKFITKVDNNRNVVTDIANTGRIGTLVFTGQQSNKKRNEFVFLNKSNPIIYENEIVEPLLKSFKDVYHDGDEKRESPDWKFWKKKLNAKGKVPVFFVKDGKGNIVHMGLSYMYKIAYTYTPNQLLPDEHTQEKLDLAQAVFGVDKLLGSRVNFMPAIATEGIESEEIINVVLQSPKPTYYPTYLEQKENAEYQTYFDENAMISGWKRYPVHRNARDGLRNSGNLTTPIRPLKGAKFKAKIVFHNLKDIELGALFSALTFHGTDENNGPFHTIGAAKPLGYGKTKIKITEIEIDYKQKEIQDFQEKKMELFEKYMNEELGEKPNSKNIIWSETEQMKELFTMAYEQNNQNDSRLAYMGLNNFRLAKNNSNNWYLKRYSELNDISTKKPKSLLDNIK